MSETRLLALETATDACSAALMIDGRVLERFELAPRRHVDLLLPFVDGLFAEAGIRVKQLDAVAFGRGPGSFTGLRIATGIAQGIAYGADVPVVPISTLAALAQGCARELHAKAVLAALDARMQEVYFGAFQTDDKGLMMPVGEEVVCSPEDIPVPASAPWYAAGEGWLHYAERMQKQLPWPLKNIQENLRPHAADIATLAMAQFQLGKVVLADRVTPVYLRNTVAAKPKV